MDFLQRTVTRAAINIRTSFWVRKHLISAIKALKYPYNGITSSSFIPSAKRWNPIGVNKTCQTKFYVGRQHYCFSVIANHRQITSLCSKTISRNYRVEDNRWKELRSNMKVQSMLEPVGFQLMLSIAFTIDWKAQTFQGQRTGPSNHQWTFWTKKSKFESGPVPFKPENQKATTITWNVASIASTFQCLEYRP